MSKVAISEDTLQIQCIYWFKAQYPKLSKRIFHPANGGSRNVKEAAKLKRMGVLPGVCDIIITIPRNEWHGLMVELKVGKNGLTEHQETFIDEHKQDYSCHVAKSIEQFQQIVNAYLNG